MVLAGLTVLLASCGPTTPMYTEGDVHLEERCESGQEQTCKAKLTKICYKDYKGFITRSETEDHRDGLTLVHLTCHPKKPITTRDRSIAGDSNDPEANESPEALQVDTDPDDLDDPEEPHESEDQAEDNSDPEHK